MKDIELFEKYTYRLLYGEKSINIVELSNDLNGNRIILFRSR